ncbi:MAG: AfsR/SARP family transcriptional regulator [Hyphomicrobiaceae bacterium]
MVDLKIRLLGGLEIVGSGERPLTRKAKAVATYLALQKGQPQSRERIAALFWENSPEEQARTNLRQCLSTLRKHFADTLIADADSVRLDTSDIDTDLERFEELIASEDSGALAEAVELYGGDLLDGFGLKEEAFEAWLRSEREHYRSMLVGGLLKLVDRCEKLKDTGAAVKWSTRLLAIDPLNETVHRALMRAYAAQGRYDAALKQFETCRDILRRDLGVEPQVETVELARRVNADRKLGVKPASKTTTVPNVAEDIARLGIDL